MTEIVNMMEVAVLVRRDCTLELCGIREVDLDEVLVMGMSSLRAFAGNSWKRGICLYISSQRCRYSSCDSRQLEPTRYKVETYMLLYRNDSAVNGQVAWHLSRMIDLQSSRNDDLIQRTVMCVNSLGRRHIHQLPSPAVHDSLHSRVDVLSIELHRQ